MSETAVILTGTLTPSGEIKVAGTPSLSPGPVRVPVEALVSSEGPGDVMGTLRRIWARRAARGAVSPTEAEVDARVAALRDEAGQRVCAIGRLQESCRRV